MFSPVYEDVSGLFGRPMTASGYGAAGELHFPPGRFTGGAQTPPQQPSQQQQQQAMLHTSYPLMDANGNVRQQASLQQQYQQQQNLAASLNGFPFGTLNGSSVIPLEVFLQQQQQSNQLSALAGKPTAIQTPDGVQYFLATNPNRTQMLTTSTPAQMLRQQGGGGPATVYAVEQGTGMGPSGNFFHTAGAPGGHGGVQNSSGDFSFFVANGLPMTNTLAMNTSTNVTGMAGVQGGIMNLSPDQRSRTLVNGTPALNLQTNVNRNVTVGDLVGTKASIEVYDPYFKYIYDVPSSAVVHLPPARLNITRLVLCRNYRPYDPQSCAMGGNCKFVHADCDYTKLEAHPIHVNYIWRHENLCTYARLPAGDVRKVVQTDGQVVELQTERILVTKGSQALMSGTASGPLSCCEAYEGKGMCCQGERCSLIHTVLVDPFVQGDFKRAPRKFDTATANHAQAFSATALQRSNSTTSGDHSQAQSQVLIQQQQQMLARRHTGSPETEGSTTSIAARQAARSNVAPSHAATPAEAVLSSSTLARLQEVVATQRDAAASTTSSDSPPQVAPSFGISLTAFAVQTLTSTTSAGTLLYLPRGAVEAVVVGPVGLTDGSASSEAMTRTQR